MSRLPSRPRLPLAQRPDGSWFIEGQPQIRQLETVQDDAPVRDWLAALEIPKDWTWLEAAARHRGLSRRHVFAVLGDESATKIPDVPRLQPSTWSWDPAEPPAVTLAHLPLVIGVAPVVALAQPGEHADCEGAVVVAVLQLFDSVLAARAWRGVEAGIFQYTSVMLARPDGAPPGTGHVREIGLTDAPGCAHARVLSWWAGEDLAATLASVAAAELPADARPGVFAP